MMNSDQEPLQEALKACSNHFLLRLQNLLCVDTN